MRLRFIVSLLVLCSLTSTAQVEFYKGTWKEAAKQAEKENKYLFVDCFTEWCYWCKVADKTTFQSKLVGDFMNDKFIAVKVDMERGNGIGLGMRYRVFGYPTFLVFEPNGQILNAQSGYTENEVDFVDRLKSMISGEDRYTYKSKISESTTMPDFYRASFTNADKDEKRVFPQPEIVKAWLDKTDDITTEVAWNVISRFDLDDANRIRFLEEIETLRALYGNREVDEKVVDVASGMMKPIMQNKDEAGFSKTLTFLDTYLSKDRIVSVKLYFQLKFAEAEQDWQAYSRLAKQAIEIDGIENSLSQANDYAWNLFLKSDDQVALLEAVAWMKIVVDKVDDYAYADTYAALHYKTKSYKEALLAAEKAIEIGNAADKKVDDTIELLEKIKEALK